MALLDTLRDRTGRKGGSAQVDCGELGVLTVEALSPAECFQLAGDSRALLYAACRELQQAGEALRQEGNIFRPDEITAYLTAEEADQAAATVLALSGVQTDSGAMSEIRHESVQAPEGSFPEIRPQSVQGDFPASGADGLSGEALWAGEDEIRLSSVQSARTFVTENGQVSREFPGADGAFADESGADKKAQILGASYGRTAQIVAAGAGENFAAGRFDPAAVVRMHETESESAGRGRAVLHETESESGWWSGSIPHETKSELRPRRLRNVHEITSESGGREGRALHEIESESGWLVHEIKSEVRNAVHEIESELREMLHESESELAEEAARRLAEALVRAAAVRQEVFR